MNSSQALKKLTAEPLLCEAVTQVADYAAASGLNPYSLCKKGLCPVCGSTGWREHYLDDQQVYFLCHKNKSHIYHLNEDEQVADRIEP